MKLNIPSFYGRFLGSVSASCFLFLNLSIVSAADVEHPTADTVYAEVNGEKIFIQEFQSAFQAGMRKRFYHGKIPPEELKGFREDVSQALIDRVLLVGEARRRNLEVDEKKLAAQLAGYEKRYADRPFWKKNKARVLPGLRKALEGESLILAIEKQVKTVELPSESKAKIFYQKNNALFTTPEKIRVSLILLKVSPASSASVWEAAKQEADDLLKRLSQGGDFIELAKIHSGDASAANGGDMGFIHKGMLAEPAQKALDKLEKGQVSAAVMTLRGIAIFRLEERQSAALNEFSQVAERARKLLQRENSTQAWDELLEALRTKADVKINSAILAVNNS